ncbi:hypothetical protein IHE44_0008994, partial [Lamprotornis superbus]
MVTVSPRLAKQAGLAFLRLGTCQARLWRNTTGSSFQMPCRERLAGGRGLILIIGNSDYNMEPDFKGGSVSSVGNTSRNGYQEKE